MDRWLAAMDQEGTLCKVRVASLDRAYRAVRAAKDSVVHPEPGVHVSRRMAALFAHAFDAVHQLYAEAHEHSPDVPLSHAQFVKLARRPRAKRTFAPQK
jgi:hypothetical protein